MKWTSSTNLPKSETLQSSSVSPLILADVLGSLACLSEALSEMTEDLFVGHML